MRFSKVSKSYNYTNIFYYYSQFMSLVGTGGPAPCR